MEWTCLDWNEPSIKFYESIGAVQNEGWRIYRLKGEALLNLSQN
jgi:RimJ/RimL family protein N-acetyltransferase